MNLFKKSRTCVTLIVATMLASGMLRPLPTDTRKHFEDNLFWCKKRYGKQQYNALFIGDSRTYEGVSPEILQKYIPNMSIYNFGFSSGRINLQLIQAAKKRLKKKRTLVFGCTSLSLSNSRNEHFFSIRKSHPVSLFLQNIWIRQNVIYIDKSRIPHAPFGYMEVKRSKNETSGLETLKAYRDTFMVRPFFPSDFDHFIRNLKWCKKNNIQVVAYRMVSCREMDELEDKLSGVDWEKIKQAVLDEGFVWLERPLSPLLEQIEAHCYDASHLNAEGAEVFSNWLGQELAKLEWFKQ